MCAIFRETNDAPSDDSLLPVIDTLLPKVLALRSKIAQAAEEEDNEALRNLMRLFCEAAEAWLVLIIRDPQKFKPLVQCILECAANDGEKAAIAISFHFWAELKLYLVLEKYIEARLEFADVLQQLVNVMINHLRYPDPEGSDNNDLFDGDREKEDNFREFRHDMGDVLKDCCEILGTAECLRHPATRIETWLSTYASQITPTIYPHWQELEAALFSLRAMGKMVNRDEAIVLPKLIPVILQLPRHERVSFAAILAIGRFTGWTSAHPEFFQAQFQYIISAFDYRETRGDEVLRAAAQALTFFCEDCSELLVNSFAQLQSFYETVQGRLPQLSRVEVTEGIGSVIYAQPIESVYDAMKLFCDPIVERIKVSADKATDKAGQRELGGQCGAAY